MGVAITHIYIYIMLCEIVGLRYTLLHFVAIKYAYFFSKNRNVQGAC